MVRWLARPVVVSLAIAFALAGWASPAGAQEPPSARARAKMENQVRSKRLDELRTLEQTVAEELAAARKQLDALVEQHHSIEAAYADDNDAVGPPSTHQVVTLMRKLAERSATDDHHRLVDTLADRMSTLREEFGRAQDDRALLDATFAELRATEKSGELSTADRNAWDRIQTERAVVLEAQDEAIRPVLRALQDLRTVNEGVHSARLDLLLLLRRKNLFLRGQGHLSWTAVWDGITEVSALPSWVADNTRYVKEYASDAEHENALLRFGAILFLIVAFLFLGWRALARRFARAQLAADTSMEAASEVGGRATATVALLIRDLAFAALLFAVPYTASIALPDVPTRIEALLQSLAKILGGLFLLRSILRELLAPEARDRLSLPVDPAAAARLWRASRRLILVAMIVLPVLAAMDHLGYENRGPREALGLLLSVVVGGSIFSLLLRRTLLDDLVPAREGIGPRLYHGAVKYIRPLAVLLVPALLVLSAMRFDLLVSTITQFLVAAIGVVVAFAVLHRLGSGVIEYRITNKFPEDGGPGMAARREAALRAGRYFLKLTLALAGLWAFSIVSADGPAGIETLLDVPLPLQGDAERAVTWWNLLVGIIILIVFVGGTGPAKLALKEFVLSRTGLDRGLRYTINTIFGYVLLITGTLLAASQVVDLSSLGYIMAAMSVGIGFGLQEIVSNFISGLILLFERPLKVGDTIRIGDTNGVVKHISIRATTVQTLDNIVMLVPNREFITQSVINYSHQDPKIRLRISVGVSYGSDTQLVKKVLLEVGNAHPQVRKQPAADVQFMSFGDSSLDFDLLVWISHPDRRNGVRSQLRFAIFEAFNKNDIEIPFPQRDLHVKSGGAPPALDSGPEET
ncbi:MAG: mechanosensitive ion channel domain-containing protein [Planctomycetota bacterium]